MNKKVKIKRIKPAVKYSGSLIQQNYSEALIHGIVVWDTKTSTSEFIEIPNDICYYTMEINNGVYSEIPAELKSKQIRLRIKVKNTDSADLKNIIGTVKSSYNIEEYTIQKINDFSNGAVRINKINIGDVRDVEYQNELITKYLENKFSLEDEMLDGIRHVNRTVNSNRTKLESSRNISWIPKRFEFSNMFSYGENNVIDFSNMKGVYGIFAPNASGKSTMLDSIAYCIFDKCGRTSKASSVLNNKASSFKCKFHFELDNVNYYIEKTGTKGRGDHVRVDVDFYYLDDLNQKVSLNGKERSETNDHIRNLLGTYEDFILTALSVQNNNTGFIDMAQKDRKDLLAQFLDINIFEDLYKIANEDIKEVATLVKEYQKQDFATQLANANILIQSNADQYKSLQLEKTLADTKIENLNKEILQLTSKLITIDSSIEDINSLQTLETKCIEFIHQVDNKKRVKVSEINTVISEIQKLETEIKQYDVEKIQSKINSLHQFKDEEKKLHGELERLKTELRIKLDKMKKLEDLKYDENCSFCMDNIFVKDAIATKTSIELDKAAVVDISGSLVVTTKHIESLMPAMNEKELYYELQKTLSAAEKRKASYESELSDFQIKQTQAEAKLVDVKRKIADYFKKEDSINTNKAIKEEISTQETLLIKAKSELKEINSQILTVHSEILVAENSKKHAEESILKLKELTKQYKFYEYYLMAVNRDGVPYDLISTAVPFIEQEINNILMQLVDFHLMLEMDGKNINCYIVYDSDNYWPIELTSGMEKFISSLAIRTALINISSLPRPNFLAIDEGLGNLDSIILTDFYNLLDYLRTRFSFIVLISHIESSKDMADSQIEIVKVNGNSYVNFQ